MMREMKILPDTQVNPETRTISFTITDNSDPVSGATVTVGDKTGTTGSAGGCTISGIVDGEHEITIEQEYYSTKTATIDVSESNTSFAFDYANLG